MKEVQASPHHYQVQFGLMGLPVSLGPTRNSVKHFDNAVLSWHPGSQAEQIHFLDLIYMLMSCSSPILLYLFCKVTPKRCKFSKCYN